MQLLKISKSAYKVVRSILFTCIALIVFIYLTLYIALSIPAVQNKIRGVAESELSALMGSKLTIGEVDIKPFNEVIISDITLLTPGGEKCVSIKTLGAGISLWQLIANKSIVITYAEIIGLDARIWQQHEGEPLNIQFLIDAFKPKEKNKPPTRFHLDIRNIVIRKSAASFNRRFMPTGNPDQFDINHLHMHSLSADIALPVVSNDTIDVDLRRLKFDLNCGFSLRHLSMRLRYDTHNISLSDFELRLPATELHLSDLNLKYPSVAEIKQAIGPGCDISIGITDSHITPADFSAFCTELKKQDYALDFSMQANYNAYALRLSELELKSRQKDFEIRLENSSLETSVTKTLLDKAALTASKILIGDLYVKLPAALTQTVAEKLPISAKRGSQLGHTLHEVNNITLHTNGYVNLSDMKADLKLKMQTGAGDIDTDIVATSTARAGDFGNLKSSTIRLNAKIEGKDLTPERVVPSVHIGQLTFDADINATVNPGAFAALRYDPIKAIDQAIVGAEVNADIEQMMLNNHPLDDITLALDKVGSDFNLQLISPNAPMNFALQTRGSLATDNRQLQLYLKAHDFRPEVIATSPTLANAIFSGDINIDLAGDDFDNLNGIITAENLSATIPTKDFSLTIDRIYLGTTIDDNNIRHTALRSDYIDGDITSTIAPASIKTALRAIGCSIMPRLMGQIGITPETPDKHGEGYMDFTFTVKKDIPWQRIAKLPVTPLYNITVEGGLNLDNSTVRVAIDAPYLQQGRDKLIRETHIGMSMADNKLNLSAHSIIPTKKGLLDFNADIMAYDDTADVMLDLNPGSNGGFYGKVRMTGAYTPQLTEEGRMVTLQFLPSELFLNHTKWDVGESLITYADKQVRVDNFAITHDKQHIEINGTASESSDDVVTVDLSDIDLNYIFDTLNINYVSFGGIATGKALASGVFSKQLDAHTQDLFVKDLSYNGTVLGDGDLSGDFDINKMRVGIGASVNESGRHVADINGGIWLNRDSLAFDFNTNKVRIGFLQPFMSAFSSKVDGRASGRGTLYGTFKDIDMVGRFYADTISVKVDFTNVVYSGRDSVILEAGRLRVPPFTLYDEYGNSATLEGELRHNYFHEPSFNFRINNAKSLLVYNTTAESGKIWYGRIFGSGTGMINGTPRMTEIIADMTTEGNSDFTFVLDDSMEATDYTFLTFTDTKKAEREVLEMTEKTEIDYILEAFNRKVDEEQGPGSGFSMDIRATVTPAVDMTLIMDPAAGDKIRARGSGPINITYNSDNDEMRMYGKYTLSEGKYNFTLQDLILKDFIIKPGSNVSFNGDPMQAVLDIRAAYRVYTNLTDLDKSFATDRDLNRTNVPVDAMLLVSGDMTDPEIRFDIELPTLNEEMTQKVTSIVASDDMMNRQIIYLLTLNRFYTPEYMGDSNSGGEWASIASTTLSSQIQNILGQLTDKFTLSPTLRSDKGDFSDLEVDVALSSRLFNNRLLFNGNFGYRDPSTSSTTFIGDFDLEYLLTKNGNFRLKAYNHFNDQNYYLKSALTTQGIGIIFRKEFDDLSKDKNKRKQNKGGGKDDEK